MKSVSRLVRTFAPDHYDLSISLHRVKRTFEGTVVIKGTTAPDAPDIRLLAKDHNITSVIVDGKKASFKAAPFDELIITHPDITPGPHIVTIGFSGRITDDMNGVYPCYFKVNGEKQELIATQFESHYARQAFP